MNKEQDKIRILNTVSELKNLSEAYTNTLNIEERQKILLRIQTIINGVNKKDSKKILKHLANSIPLEEWSKI